MPQPPGQQPRLSMPLLPKDRLQWRRYPLNWPDLLLYIPYSGAYQTLPGFLVSRIISDRDPAEGNKKDIYYLNFNQNHKNLMKVILIS
jgi:hypothetical protein